MPKLKKSEMDKKNEMLIMLIKKNMVVTGIDYAQDLAEIIGINRCTLSQKMKHPERFTRQELMRIFEILKFSPEEKVEVM